MKTIGITGGTGFVGRHLFRQLLEMGHQVIVFSRSSKKGVSNIHYAQWDPARQEIDKEALRSLDAVVHLAGAGVADKRWTDKRKKEIISSRVDATDFLLRALKEYAPNCRTFVAASATGYYGPDRGQPSFKEGDPPYNDFLAQVCVLWENVSREAESFCRTSIFRFGIVLGGDGGAYPELSAPMRFGIRPILGSGKQIVSWVHVEDVAGMLCAAITDESFSGVYNAVASQPVTHRELMKAIAKAKGGFSIPIPVPGFILRIVIGEASTEVLKSCTVSNEKVLQSGYVFRYPLLPEALRAIVGRRAIGNKQ